MKKQLLFFAAFLLFLNTTYSQDAVYKIKFISNWSSTTHPTDYPSGSAHWSKLVGTTHNTTISFFEMGQLSTAGVKDVAETGNNTVIKQEINASISNNNAYEIIEGSGLGTGPGTITINDVNVDFNYPLISLITMIAPSPDWVAQINNLKLTDDNNDWKQAISVEVYATDAGTDNGTTYKSDNEATSPPANISSLENTTPFSNQIIGTFKFTLQQVLSVNDNVLQNTITVSPNPSNGEIHIRNFGSNTIKKVEIFIVEGKKILVFNTINNQGNLNLHTLTKGLYFLKISTNSGSFVKKIILK